MANKPTKAEYEGFKKAVANPMTPAPIKQKLQSIIDQYSSEYEGGSQAPKAEPKSRAGRKPSTTKKYKPLPKPKMVAMVTATTQAFAEMKAQLKKFGYDPEKVDALSDNEAFAILEEVKVTMTKRKPSTPRATKKTATDIEKAKAEIKAKTGKTEEECEAIIEQYRALRSKAQEGKRKAEQATATNRKRVAKLEDKGDLIEGTNVKTADAVIETTAQEVAEKIEQEIEAVEAKAETEAKAEVAKDNTKKTPKQKKEAVEAKVEKKVKERTKIIVKKVVIDTSALLTSISESLGKFDKDSQKEFLIKLRSDIDTLISKYAFGGMTDGATQVMNVQQSNLSASSVNPTLFARGGGVGSKKFDSGEINDDTNLDVSDSLKSKLRKKLGLKPNDDLDSSKSQVYFLSYSDNQKGTLFNKVMIDYLEKEYPQDIVVEKTKNNGKDAFIIGNTAERYIEAVEDFGGRSFDDYSADDNYFEILKEMELKEFNKYLDDLEAQEHIFDREEALGWLKEMRGGGYYEPYPNRIELDRFELDEDLEAEGIVKFTYAKGGGVDEGIQFATVIKKDDKNYNKIGYSKLTEFIKDKQGNEFDKLYFEGKKLPTKYNVDDLNYMVRELDTFSSSTGDRKFILLKELTDDNRIYYYILHFDDKKVYAEGYNMDFIKSEIKRLTNGKNFYAKAGVRFASGGGVGKLDSGVYRIGKPTKIAPNLYEQKIVQIFEDGEIATASDYGKKLSDFRSQKYPIITQQQLDNQSKFANGGGVEDDLTFVSGEAFYVTEESAKNSNMSFDTLSDTYFDSEYDFERMIRNGAILSFDFSVEVRNEWNIKQAIYDQMESEGLLENEGVVQLVGYRLFTHPNDFNDSLPYDSDDYNDDDDYEDDEDYARGGSVKTNSKEVKQKIRQHILDSVYDYNENEFDNFNDASQHLSDEFKRVADYPNNIKRYPNNQKRFKDYLQGIPFNFFIYDDDIEDFLNGLGINPKNKKYSSDQMWDLYSLLIWREIEPTYKSNKFEDGGVVGQEIVFDDNGEENTGVIKDITNLGDYIVKADDGRTLLAQRELDVISLGAMRSASTEAPKKRFGFFAKGGRVFGEDARLEYVDDAFASDELKEKLMDKLGIETNSLGDNVVISFAYTDYGGDFLDKVAIIYFQENYPENTLVENAGYGGQNAYVFGEPAQEWIDSTDDYPLGFEDIESFYYDMVSEAEYESFEYFLDDLERDDYVFDKDEVMDWLMENKGGYYSMTTQGLDFSYSDLTDELVDEGLISKEDEYARGGKLWIDTKTKGGLKGVKPSRKNSFTRQAQKRGLTSGQLASKVLANPSRYKDINPKSAQLVKNMGVRKHGGSIGDILRNRRGQ